VPCLSRVAEVMIGSRPWRSPDNTRQCAAKVGEVHVTVWPRLLGCPVVVLRARRGVAVTVVVLRWPGRPVLFYKRIDEWLCARILVSMHVLNES
jgi:hypothetical protein